MLEHCLDWSFVFPNNVFSIDSKTQLLIFLFSYKKMRLSSYLLKLSFLLLILGFGKIVLAQKNVSKPNFIFYLADDQDVLDYGSYGNPKVPTPDIDQLAKEGMKFNKCYTAQAICAPSRSQLYTGLYPFKNGVIANHFPSKNNILSITSYLKELGYDVILAGKSHVKPNSVYDWTYEWPPVGDREIPLEQINTYLSTVRKPFCLFVTSDYPHAPYPKNTAYTADKILKLPYEDRIPEFKGGYYHNIEYDDSQVKAVLDMVDKYKLRVNSVFVYSSDHGITGKYTVKERGLNVPLIIRWPGKIKPGSVNNNYVQFIDVVPTFVEMAGGKAPQNIDGRSFLANINGADKEVHDYIYGISTDQNIQKCSVFPSRMVISTKSKFKFIRNYNSLEVYKNNLGKDPIINAFIKIGAEAKPNVPFEELYDLSKDPYELKNLAKNPAFTREKSQLTTVLNSWLKQQGDFLAIPGAMPLIKPNQHPLDKNSQWNKVPENLLNSLTPDKFIKFN
jgi:uncharacterized sulfatase